MMNVRPIRSEDDLTWALAEIAPYFDEPPALGSPEGDRFDVLATLIAAYETAHHPIPDVDPIAILHFAIAEMGRSQADLAELIGSRSRASEILNRRRPMTLDQIRLISEAWALPIDTLTGHYDLQRAQA